jgi:DNA-directed RNA polymerase specialized sigma subunit
MSAILRDAGWLTSMPVCRVSSQSFPLHYGAPVSELVAEGNAGLLTAMAKFDPERGVRFAMSPGSMRRSMMKRSRGLEGQSIAVPRSRAALDSGPTPILSTGYAPNC